MRELSKFEDAQYEGGCKRVRSGSVPNPANVSDNEKMMEVTQWMALKAWICRKRQKKRN